MTKEGYKNNIKILDVKIITNIIGETIIIKILDNNKKFFKRKKLYEEYFEICDSEFLDKEVNKILEYYLWRNYKYDFRQQELNNILEQWKKSK